MSALGEGLGLARDLLGLARDLFRKAPRRSRRRVIAQWRRELEKRRIAERMRGSY